MRPAEEGAGGQEEVDEGRREQLRFAFAAEQPPGLLGVPERTAGPAGMPTSTSRVIEFVLVRTVASTPSRIRSRPANSSRARRRVETLHLVDGEQRRRLIAKRVDGR